MPDSGTFLTRKSWKLHTSRHLGLGAFRLRQLTIDVDNDLLLVRDGVAGSDSSRLELPLSALEVENHAYFVSSSSAGTASGIAAGKYCLSVSMSPSLSEATPSSDLEILIFFESDGELQHWKLALQNRQLATAQDQEAVNKALTRLRAMIRSRVSIQHSALCSLLWGGQLVGPPIGISSGGGGSGGGSVASPAPPPPPLATIPPPPMRILILCVGTHGDVEPMCDIAAKLMKDGNSVRLATHACYRDFVTNTRGLEYYPLAGCPRELSSLMVSSNGNFFDPSGPLLSNLGSFQKIMREIIESCWLACIAPDPLGCISDDEDEDGTALLPDAIIASPVSFAHVHIAEALGIPLHLVFPQPWVPTKAFPHPLSCLPYNHGWSTENFLSYTLWSRLGWLGLEATINQFRTETLGLEPLGVGAGGWDLLNSRRIPFSKLWSPSFVPKPKDWPSNI